MPHGNEQTGKDNRDLQLVARVLEMNRKYKTPIRTACKMVGIDRRRFYYLSPQIEKASPASEAPNSSSLEEQRDCNDIIADSSPTTKS